MNLPWVVDEGNPIPAEYATWARSQSCGTKIDAMRTILEASPRPKLRRVE